ncbi:MAG: ABC transporter substrate-binding protein [Desulfatirhabdiaceae bacterium]|nr:ABC transporter substrate-binding protein [Desulfatirhabdiaceae bacterium]
MKSRYLIWLYTALILFAGGASGAEVINIGALSDLTGATSDVGKDYAMGIAEAVHYVNDTGGINGKAVKLFQFDYGYRIPEALTKYYLFKQKKCVAVLGWGTGDTEALAPFVDKDKMPYVSAFYPGHLCDPKKAPYNLFFATDYSTQARGLITAWFDKKWPTKPDFGKRKPRIACAYMTASPLSSASIKAAKDQATILGFDIGPDQDVSLLALETKNQIQALKEFKPDVVLHTNTVLSVAATLRDAHALELGADHIIMNWGYDENLPVLAGKAAEGALGCAPWAFFGQNVKLMDKVMEYAQKYNPGIPPEKRTIHTVQAWGNVLGLAEALKRADKAGDLSGESILKKGFETMTDFEIGLGLAPVSFSGTDHRPQSKVKVYEFKSGKFALLDEVDLKTRWPDKWKSEWIGW